MKSSLSTSVHQSCIYIVWLLIRPFVRLRVEVASASAYIVASDVVALLGAKGDEAMLTAVLDSLREIGGIVRVKVTCSGEQAEQGAKRLGMQSLPVWGSIAMPLKFWAGVRQDRPAMAVVVGADVMDGYYSPVESLRRLIAADLLARSGARTIFTGFSFSGASNRLLRSAFRRVHPSVRFALRDPVSAKRFADDVGVAATLVADCAFLLHPEDAPVCADALGWIKEEQANGRLVIAINLHPLLFKGGAAAEQVAKLESLVAEALLTIGTARPVSWLLFPHDDRPQIGDLDSLGRVAAMLGRAMGTRFHHLQRPPAAAAIKGLVAHVDGVVTGRMHLAIAALGSGVPILAFAYQAKFAGLLQHFELPHDLLLDPAQTLQDGPDALAGRLARFIDDLPGLRQTVADHLPRVKRLAEANFSGHG